jgi:hypothetical protein
LWQVNKILYDKAVDSYGKGAFAIPVKSGLNEESDSEEEEVVLQQCNPQWQVTCIGGAILIPAGSAKRTG